MVRVSWLYLHTGHKGPVSCGVGGGWVGEWVDEKQMEEWVFEVSLLY